MPAVQREFPDICTTWLPKLLTGESSCEWAVWFKAHHQNWDKIPSDFNQTEWMLNHIALLNKRRANWEVGGYSIEVEGQNRFELRGEAATLAGKPDLIARRDGEAVIIDAKTGHESPSHIVQVMIYLYAVPRALEPCRNLKLSGQVTYRDHTVRIPAEAVNDQFIQNLGTLTRRLAAERPAPCVPLKDMFLNSHSKSQRQKPPAAAAHEQSTSNTTTLPNNSTISSRSPSARRTSIHPLLRERPTTPNAKT